MISPTLTPLLTLQPTHVTVTNITIKQADVLPRGVLPRRINNKYNPFWLVVSPKRKVAITIIPKVMCSTIRKVINYDVEECASGTRCAEARRNRRLRVNHTMYLHDDHYKTVLFVRDPFERALSAYHNSDVNTFIYTDNCKNTEQCSFEEWVDEVVNHKKSKDVRTRQNEHFKTQTEIAQFDQIEYAYKLRMSSKSDIMFFFRNLLGLKDKIPAKTNESKNSHHPSDKGKERASPSKLLYPQKTMDQLASFYKKDLELWQTLLDHGTPRREGEESTLYDNYMNEYQQTRSTDETNNKSK